MLQNLLFGFIFLMHPFYVSVVEINHNAKEKVLEISVRIFTEDLEETLKLNFPKEKTDLYAVQKNAKTDSLISTYVRQKLQLSTGKTPLVLRYVGFEKIDESIWSYFEVPGIASINQLHISDKLLYDFKKEQINMHHVIVNENRQSRKLDNPNSELDFSF